MSLARTHAIHSKCASTVSGYETALAYVGNNIDSQRNDAHMGNTLYYLPGYGGELRTGLGEELVRRGFHIEGRETIGEFSGLPFQMQIDIVAEDLTERFWHADARVVANSFGAYLFLHAQTMLEPYPGKVLLLSPILGAFAEPGMGKRFLPPRRKRLMQLAESGEMPMPTRCEAHVGADDWQSNPTTVALFCGLTGISFTVAQAQGHMLDKAHVARILDVWLEEPWEEP